MLHSIHGLEDARTDEPSGNVGSYLFTPSGGGLSARPATSDSVSLRSESAQKDRGSDAAKRGERGFRTNNRAWASQSFPTSSAARRR
jgi:hypothetical protein